MKEKQHVNKPCQRHCFVCGEALRHGWISTGEKINSKKYCHDCYYGGRREVQKDG